MDKVVGTLFKGKGAGGFYGFLAPFLKPLVDRVDPAHQKPAAFQGEVPCIGEADHQGRA